MFASNFKFRVCYVFRPYISPPAPNILSYLKQENFVVVSNLFYGHRGFFHWFHIPEVLARGCFKCCVPCAYRFIESTVFDICTVFSDIFCRSHSKRAVTEFQLPVWRKMFIFLFENARQTIMLGGKKIFVIPSQTHLRNVVVNFRDDRRSSTRQFHGWKEIPSIKLTSVRCDTFRVWTAELC